MFGRAPGGKDEGNSKRVLSDAFQGRGLVDLRNSCVPGICANQIEDRAISSTPVDVNQSMASRFAKCLRHDAPR
jgi:hypothetical protein